MIGTRVRGKEPHQLDPGEYGIWEADGHWYACTPNDEIANLASHGVAEHDDGTITVTPSILVSTSVRGQRKEVWHGFLERGVWRNA